MMSQWNVGPAGAVGLRYETLPLLLELHCIEKKRQRELFDGLREMEQAALGEMNNGR